MRAPSRGTPRPAASSSVTIACSWDHMGALAVSRLLRVSRFTSSKMRGQRPSRARMLQRVAVLMPPHQGSRASGPCHGRLVLARRDTLASYSSRDDLTQSSNPPASRCSIEAHTRPHTPAHHTAAQRHTTDTRDTGVADTLLTRCASELCVVHRVSVHALKIPLSVSLISAGSRPTLRRSHDTRHIDDR